MPRRTTRFTNPAPARARPRPTATASGEHLFAGRTDDGLIRRGVIAFDLTNSVPAGSVITAVTLSLYCSRTKDASETVTLHRCAGEAGVKARPTPSRKRVKASRPPSTTPHGFIGSILPRSGLSPAACSSPAPAPRPQSRVKAFYSWTSDRPRGRCAGMGETTPALTSAGLIKGGEGATKTVKRFDTREAATINQATRCSSWTSHRRLRSAPAC